MASIAFTCDALSLVSGAVHISPLTDAALPRGAKRDGWHHPWHAERAEGQQVTSPSIWLHGGPRATLDPATRLLLGIWC